MRGIRQTPASRCVTPLHIAAMVAGVLRVPGMAHYRVYRVDERGHVFGPPQEFIADLHEEAMERAGQMVDGFAVELWSGPVRVAQFAPRSSTIVPPAAAAQKPLG